MIIVQMTDLHVVARGRLCYDRVPTNAQLAEAVAHINKLDPRPDAIIVSGDLTDHGCAEEYEMMLAQREPARVPGNVRDRVRSAAE